MTHIIMRSHAGSLLRGKANGVVVILLLLVTLQNLYCSKKIASFMPTDTLGINNKWLYDSMKLYYYWSDQMTSKPEYSLPTQQLFTKLLSVNDRFSWISNRADIGPVGSSDDYYGFYYSLITHPFDTQKLIGVITMVIPGTTASALQLKRGMFFSKVNGEGIDASTMNRIVAALNAKSTVTLQLAALNNDGTALVDSASVVANYGYVPSMSVYATRFFETGGKKTGYLAYFQCVESQDQVLLESILKLKNAGVTELILDLRYNPGGSVASSAKLATMLVPSFNPDMVYVTFKGNHYGGTVKQTFGKAISFSGYNSSNVMEELKTRNLALTRLYILTAGATVSAAELLCNNLKPYMEVIRIGDTTRGKDEASFRIEDKRSPRQVEWVLMPTIYKIFDANGKGDYSKGLIPDYTINEFDQLPLNELGYPGDLCLDKALQLIYGNQQVVTTALRKKTYSFPAVKMVYNSGAVAGGVEMKR